MQVCSAPPMTPVSETIPAIAGPSRIANLTLPSVIHDRTPRAVKLRSGSSQSGSQRSRYGRFATRSAASSSASAATRRRIVVT